MTDEHRPLLPSDVRHFTSQTRNITTSAASSGRRQTKRFLTSKYGHYSVLVLVSVDVTGIFADLIIQLLTCEGRIGAKQGGVAQEVLGNLSLVFSCLCK
jgi:voltage-gated hydrogen channel 1